MSLILASLFMEEFETKSINTAANSPRQWITSIDDTFIIQQTKNRAKFLKHNHSFYPHIQFTAEALLLDTLVTPEVDNTLLTTVNRQPTCNDHHLQWDSNHNHNQNKVCSTPTHMHRTRTVCLNPLLLQKEEEHVKGAVQMFRFPNWVLMRLK